MKEMDYMVTSVGRQRTISARTERAKIRTPELITYSDNANALEFIKAATAEGYRFSGQELVDREYKLVRYVYFVRIGAGRFEPRGQDWGPPDPVFEPGDVFPGGPRNGMEAIVLSVVRGKSAEFNGGDIMVLLQGFQAAGAIQLTGIDPPISKSVYWEMLGRAAEHQKQEEDRVSRYGEVRPQISLESNGYRLVVVGGKVHYSKDWRFFPDFLRDYIAIVFGREWIETELSKQEADQHQIVQCRSQALRFMNSQTSQPDGRVSSLPNGFLAAYLSLAYDLYTVADNHRLDDFFLQRLKHHDQFQGARHELFAESTCLRAGYAIERENEQDRSRRHAEFSAKHRTTGQLISVEAKSKHRPGVLGRPGAPPEPDKFSLRFGELVNDALRKNPMYPLVVFIDTNLPTRVADRVYGFRRVQPPVPSRIMTRLLERIRLEHGGIDPYALLVFTNHPHHYGASNEVDPGVHLLSVIPTQMTQNISSDAIVALHEAANLYGNIPNEFSV
jgi:hypothetical protein